MDCCGKKSNYMLVEIVFQSSDTDFGQLLNRVPGIQQTNLLKPIKISLDTHIGLVGSKITSQNMYTQVIIIYFPRFGKKCFRTKF